MKTFKNSAAQGDVFLHRVNKLPKGAKRVNSEQGKLIVGHSETGHHHYLEQQNQADLDAALYSVEGSENLFLEVKSPFADLIHGRSFDTHETLRVPQGIFEVRQQKEFTPQGWQRVAD